MRNGIGRLGIAAAVVGLSLLGPAPSSAVPFTGHFNALRENLEYRRDNDFLDVPLEKAAKKHQKAVLKTLKLLDRTADDLGDDLSTLVTVATTLEKGYPESSFPALLPSLPDLLADARRAFGTEVDDEVDALEARVGKFAPSKLKDKAGSLYSDAREFSQSGPAGGSVSTWAKFLVKAWKTLVKANKLLDKGVVLPAPSMTFTVDSTPYTADTISWKVDPDQQGIFLTGNFTNPATGDQHRVNLEALGVDGPGSFPLNGNPDIMGYYRVPPSYLTEYWSTGPSGGTITLDSLDVAHSTMSGTFTFTATGGPSSTQVTVTGTFTATWNLTFYGDAD